jgi:hypothetical protein
MSDALKQALTKVREALELLTKVPRVRFSAIIDTSEKLVHLHNLGTDQDAARFCLVAAEHMALQSPEVRLVRCVACDETFYTNKSPPAQCTQCGSTVTEMS